MVNPRPWKRLPDGTWEKINEDGTRDRMWGRASSGEIAPEGRAYIKDHPSGRQDALVRPSPVSVSASTSADFVKEPPDELRVDLEQLERALVQAIANGEIRYKRRPDGSAQVEFEDFRRWINGLQG